MNQIVNLLIVVTMMATMCEAANTGRLMSAHSMPLIKGIKFMMFGAAYVVNSKKVYFALLFLANNTRYAFTKSGARALSKLVSTSKCTIELVTKLINKLVEKGKAVPIIVDKTFPLPTFPRFGYKLKSKTQ